MVCNSACDITARVTPIELRATLCGSASRRSDRFTRDQALTLGALARQFACATNGFSLLASLLLGRLLVVTAKLHFPEDAFPLHLLLQGFEGLVDVIVADENLHALYPVFEVAR